MEYMSKILDVVMVQLQNLWIWLHYTDFGGEIIPIASACIHGNYGAYGNGNGVTSYLIGTNFAYIGLGKEVDNDPNTGYTSTRDYRT